MGISTADYITIQARLSHNQKKAEFCEDVSTGKPVDREKDLHDQIEEFCISQGFLYRHDRMDKKTTGQVGWPDYTIFAPNRAVAFIECKAKGKKATTAQLAKLAHARKLGFEAVVVDSYQDFIHAMNRIL